MCARAIGESLSTFYGYGPEAPQLWRAERARARARAKYPEKIFLIEVPWLILNLEMKIRNRSLPASKTPTPAPSMTHFETRSEHQKSYF